MEELLITGWKDIANKLSVRSIKTAKKLVRKYSMPVVYMNKRPTVLDSVFRKWYVNVLEKAKQRRKGYVYFIKAKNLNLIKVGFSDDPQKRLMALKLMSPIEIELLETMPGTLADEKKIHKKLKKYQSHGEWFFESRKLYNIINKMAKVEKT